MKKKKTLWAVLLLTAVCVACVDPAVDADLPLRIPFEKYTLDNGLDVVLHRDTSDPIVALSILVHVGSSREKPGRTGFAHFFEHMSFNDSENVPRKNWLDSLISSCFDRFGFCADGWGESLTSVVWRVSIG